MTSLESSIRRGSTLPLSSSASLTTSYEEVFVRNYKREFGFELVGRRVLVDDLRVRAVGHASHSLDLVPTFLPSSSSNAGAGVSEEPAVYPVSAIAVPEPTETVSAYFDGGWSPTPVFSMTHLLPGQTIVGPAIVIQDITTIVVEPGCEALITASGDIEITVLEASKKVVSAELDPIYLSIFSHR